MRRALTAVVVLLLALSVVLVVRSGGTEDRTLTATFERTTSLYDGAKVKVLGVAVGTVEDITVKGTAVEVRISYDGDVKLPADVHALVVPPSIVGDRFVQLAPAFEGGDTLEDGAELGLDRTGVPVELDETYSALDKFARGLGPDGANADGALSRLVAATAANITGQGEAFNQTVRDLSGAISTLAGSSGDINSTVDNLATLSTTLAGKDEELRALVNSLARVGAQLNGQRDDISSSVVELQGALELIAGFVAENRAALTTGIGRAKDVTAVLSKRTAELARLLDLAPVGLTNLANIYIPTNWDPSKPWESTIAGRTGSANLRGNLFSDLESNLAFTLTSLCGGLPAEQQAQISALCSGLAEAGGSLGALLSAAIEQGVAVPTSGATSFRSLMGGPR